MASLPMEVSASSAVVVSEAEAVLVEPAVSVASVDAPSLDPSSPSPWTRGGAAKHALARIIASPDSLGFGHCIVGTMVTARARARGRAERRGRPEDRAD